MNIKDLPGYIPPEDITEIRYDTLSKVLEDLRPGAEFVIRGNNYEDIEWHSKNLIKPTEEEIANRMKELSELWENHRYKRKRRLEYPKWEDLADALYHKENGDDSKMIEYLNMVQEVKDKYPKPE